MSTTKPRRRVVRHSDAPNIDRSVDSPRHGFTKEQDPDADRVDPHEAESDGDGAEVSDVDFLREELPPHYGA